MTLSVQAAACPSVQVGDRTNIQTIAANTGFQTPPSEPNLKNDFLEGGPRQQREQRKQSVAVRQRRRVAFLQQLEGKQDMTLAAAREDVIVGALVRKPVAQVRGCGVV